MDYSKREVERNYSELKKRKEWKGKHFSPSEILNDRINKALIIVGVVCLVGFIIGMVLLFT